MTAPIDREALVRRHTVVLREPVPDHVLTVGNGDFAFSTDATGMQSLSAFHSQAQALKHGGSAIDTCTMSTWGWHEMPNPSGFTLDDAMTVHETAHGPVSYPDLFDGGRIARGEELRAGEWLHVNPQRINLARIGLRLQDAGGETVELTPARLHAPTQTLDLWTGRVHSTFLLDGHAVEVHTVAAPDSATVAFRVRSDLLVAAARLSVVISFPYASDDFFDASNWANPHAHSSALSLVSPSRATISRRMDSTLYRVGVDAPNARVRPGAHEHEFEVLADSPELELVVAFSPGNVPSAELPSFDRIDEASANSWARFWNSGAALDLGGATDPRAAELERRVVLSQYLTAVNCSGELPPQETGLITNSWNGKFHLEMHFWHAAHFAAWGRGGLLQRSLGWYRSILDSARATARRQGYPGARWPKQVGPDGRESPTPIGALLVWQQPHILYLLELLWAGAEEDVRRELLRDYADIVEATAMFMAGFAESVDGTYHLAAPVMPAQESYDATTTSDPTFELAYWWWGLEIAQLWRERAGRSRHADWSAVQDRLAKPDFRHGHYSAIATEPYLRLVDHPSLLASFGVVPPTPLIDADAIEATLDFVVDNWEWADTWGWDFAVLSMTALRLGRPESAIELLLRDEVKNRYTAVGHNPQLPGLLPIYLPGNGALLAAVSMIASTLDENGRPAFPAEWNARVEGFVPWPTGAA